MFDYAWSSYNRNFPLPFTLQKVGDPLKKDRVVLLLQDMLEVVTRDMMVNEIRLVSFVAISFSNLF